MMIIKYLLGWYEYVVHARMFSMNTQPVVYALRDPRDWHVYYVGYTKNLFRRIHYHFRDRKHEKRGGTLAKEWLIELAEVGLLPVSEILEVVQGGVDWEARERYWIANLRELGEPLLNGTDGGLSARPSAKSQIKKAESLRRAWAAYTPEQREARSRAIREHYTGNQYRTKDGELIPSAEQARLQTGESARRFWESASAETKDRISAAHRAAFDRMEENKKQIVLAALDAGRHRKGRRHTWRLESRAKVGRSMAEIWAVKSREEKVAAVSSMLIARKSVWDSLTEEERKAKMEKVRAGKKH